MQSGRTILLPLMIKSSSPSAILEHVASVSRPLVPGLHLWWEIQERGKENLGSTECSSGKTDK